MRAKLQSIVLSCAGAVMVLLSGCSVMQNTARLIAAHEGYQSASNSYQQQTRTMPQPAIIAPISQSLPASLEGCRIIAHDGQLLGVISRSELEENSILNRLGKYGSELSETSIFNKLGKYGSELSEFSPFNKLTSTPPKIVSETGRLVGYLTKNSLNAPAVDPNLLLGLLGSHGNEFDAAAWTELYQKRNAKTQDFDADFAEAVATQEAIKADRAAGRPVDWNGARIKGMQARQKVIDARNR